MAYHSLTLTREDAFELAKLQANSGRKIEAIKTVRAVTGWSLKETKEYVEGGFKSMAKVGDRVSYNNDYNTVVAAMEFNGKSYLWLTPENLLDGETPFTALAKEVTVVG